MTIHHDKMAYGRLASLHEDFSAERLAQMVSELEEGAQACEKELSRTDGKDESCPAEGNEKRPAIEEERFADGEGKSTEDKKG